MVAPRFWAGVISMPLLAAMFSAMGVYGGYLVGVVVIGSTRDRSGRRCKARWTFAKIS